jgi:hypothetical protein
MKNFIDLNKLKLEKQQMKEISGGETKMKVIYGITRPPFALRYAVVVDIPVILYGILPSEKLTIKD